MAGLTLLALLLRVVAFGDGLYGDELITVDDTRGDLAAVFDGLDRNEINPPLFYLLAWAAAQLGDAVSLIRIPSIVFGTALVPVVYGLGARLADRRAGLVAALLVALSPFAIFYSTEARAYASATFFVALAALALLCALEPGARRVWWVVYGLATLAAIYTHYTTVYVTLGLALWVLFARRDRVGRVALVLALVALAYLPWVPTLLEQRDNDLFVAVVGLGSDLSAGRVFEYPAKLVSGHPFLTLKELPGTLSYVLLAIGAAVALLALALPRLRRPDAPSDRAALAFVAVLALAAPVGLLVYSLLADDLYVPRNLSTALPGLALALGWMLTALRPAPAAVAAALLIVPSAGSAVRSTDHSRRRPDSIAAAAYIERTARPSDVVAIGLGDVGALPLYLHGHEVLTEDDPEVWSAARRGRAVYLLRGEVGRLRLLPRFAGPGGRYELGPRLELSGLRKLGVGRYSGPVSARLEGPASREVIALSSGERIAVVPGAVRGAEEGISEASGTPAVTGWAFAGDRSRPAEGILVMKGRRCVGFGSPGILRADLAADFGESIEGAGYSVPIGGSASGLRVFGVIGDRASELSPG